MASISDSKSLSEEIDLLLEQYLELLDQHTTLRTQLSTVQSSIHQNIARANFTAERGIRYGADCYDERMQAGRVCRVTAVGSEDTSAYGFEVSMLDKGGKPDGEEEGLENEKTTTRTKDPTRMFGILVPQALRMAQRDAAKMVEDLIPKLVEVDREMRVIEIEIRRRRKYKAKAEALEAKGGLAELEKGTVVECPS